MRTGRHYNKCKWGVLCTRVPIYIGSHPSVPFGLQPYIRAIGHAIVQIGNNNKPKNYDRSNPDNKLLKILLAIESFPLYFVSITKPILHELCNYRFVSFIETAINSQANIRYSDKKNAYASSMNSTIKFSEKCFIKIVSFISNYFYFISKRDTC